MPNAYFVGIKGVGMTALALAMQDAGWQIIGSDTGESFITDRILSARKIEVKSFLGSPPAGVDLIVYSGAYPRPNTKIRTLSLGEALAEFVHSRRVIAVAGVGGKTTVSAMLAVLMRSVGRDVGYYIGTGSVSGLIAPGAAGTDPYFILEADEYALSKDDHQAKFLLLTPQILVTTNLLHDHPDVYPDATATLATFQALLHRLKPGTSWICNPDDPLTSRLLTLQKDFLKSIKIIRYGSKHLLYPQLKLSVFGDHNRLNALAAVLAAREAGLAEKEALSAIFAYHGAQRRQEKKGEFNGRLLYDDYAHHPDEIVATVKAFRQEFPARRLVLIFESHTYSRTEALFSEFIRALALADQVFVMPIFESAREKGQPHTVSARALAKKITALGTPARAVSWDNAAQVITQASRKGDLLLTMGAGFVYKLHSQLATLLEL